MSEINSLNKELDRLLKIAPAEELRNPLDSVCYLSIELKKGVYFQPLSSEDELELATRKGPSARDEKSKYGDDLFRASKCLEKQFQMPDAEKLLEKLVIFDQNSKCFEGVAAEHLFHLALNEERQGKLSEAEKHYLKGIEETAQEKRAREIENRFLFGQAGKRKSFREESFVNTDEEPDDIPKDMRKAENYAALARLARRHGFDEQATELLTNAYRKDGTNARYLQQVADPKNFDELYFDWILYK
jgi:tetratricopeptide (TPR) repeat protein